MANFGSANPRAPEEGSGGEENLSAQVRLLVEIDVHDRAAQYDAARALHKLGPRYVLVKGGHLGEDVDQCVDVLYDGQEFTFLTPPEVRKERARQIAEDPEKIRQWNEYRASTLPPGEG